MTLACTGFIVGTTHLSLDDLERVTAGALAHAGYRPAGVEVAEATRIVSMDLDRAGAWAFLADEQAAAAILARIADLGVADLRLHRVGVRAELGPESVRAWLSIDGGQGGSLGTDGALRSEVERSIEPADVLESLLLEAFTRARRHVLLATTIVAERESQWSPPELERAARSHGNAREPSPRVRALRAQYLRAVDRRVEELGNGRVRLRLVLPDGAQVVSLLDSDELTAVVAMT